MPIYNPRATSVLGGTARKIKPADQTAPVAAPAPVPAAPTAAPQLNAYGAKSNLDEGYLREQIRASWKKQNPTLALTPEHENYWLDWSRTPQLYSDNKWRIGFNPYAEARMAGGGNGSANPALAGEEGLIAWTGQTAPTPDPNWKPNTAAPSPASVLGGAVQPKGKLAQKLVANPTSGLAKFVARNKFAPKVGSLKTGDQSLVEAAVASAATDPSALPDSLSTASFLGAAADSATAASAYGAMDRLRRKAKVGGRQGTIAAGFGAGRPTTAPSVLGGY